MEYIFMKNIKDASRPMQYVNKNVLKCKNIGPKRDEMTGGWRKLHNEELHNVYSSPSIIRMTKSRRMRWTGHVARMGRTGMHIKFCWEIQKERDH
jgi:hypothetical protein